MPADPAAHPDHTAGGRAGPGGRRATRRPSGLAVAAVLAAWRAVPASDPRRVALARRWPALAAALDLLDRRSPPPLPPLPEPHRKWVHLQPAYAPDSYAVSIRRATGAQRQVVVASRRFRVAQHASPAAALAAAVAWRDAELRRLGWPIPD